MKSRIVITDPHGCYKTLVALVAKLPVGIPITFAGDLIDRGHDSRKVVEFVRNGGHDCVVGNHECFMMNDLQFRKAGSESKELPYVDYYRSSWSTNGGDRCLESYAVEKEEELENGEKIKVKQCDVAALKSDQEWFKTLPYFLEYKDVVNDKGDYLLVTHSTAADVWDRVDHESAHFRNVVTWDRVDNPRKIPGIYNVYGHTPQPNKATIGEHYACIDTGAYFKRADYGKLTALQFPEMIVYTQENIE